MKGLSKKIGKIASNLRDLGQALKYKSGKKDHPPIFIVGCGHSGTSLLLAVLGAHSHIYAVPNETGLAFDATTGKPGVTKEAQKSMHRFDKKAIEEKKMRWVEKTPSHIRCIPQLLEICPDGKILLIIRDGRDVACSIQDRTGNLEEGITRWVNENRMGQAFWDHPQVYSLKYEQLIEEFKETMTGVMEFLGEDFEEQMLNHHEKPKHFYSNTVEKPSNAFGENHVQYRNWQINQPLFDGRGKWKRLSEEEKQLIKTHAGDMLIEYGYVENMAW